MEDDVDQTVDAEPERARSEERDTVGSRWQSASGDPRGRAVPDRGEIIGRYVVLAKLGAGAMGVVLAAYDPELDRKVALKLLKTRSGRDEEAARARLHREAQALAKLNHTNVVAVHDVGVHEGRVFVAMEFVQGQTLADWLSAERRPWREVVRVFEAAGKGLAAAHQEELIHRDFKPENVMLGDDGRVRVMDFGLARAGDGEASRVDLAELSASGRDSLSTPLTATGSLMGTPAYMSPEQFTGQEVTPRSDQFSYCVALHEALYGARPFRGDSLAALAFATTQGKLADIPRNAGVPAWLRRVLLRGLSPDPADRFDSVSSLLAELATGEARRRRNWLLSTAAILGLSGASLWAFQQWDDARKTALCEQAGDEIDTIWNQSTREALREGLLATGVSYAETTADKVMPYFDAQAEALRTAQTDACVDATVREVWGADLLERATWCLDDRRMQLEALSDELSRADEASIQNAVTAAARLLEVKACRDESRLRRASLPPRDREAVQTIRRQLSAASARAAAGRFPESLSSAREALAQAEEIGWPMLVASARYSVGSSLGRAGEHEAAQDALERAYFDAAELGASELMADVATMLVYTEGYKRARHEAGHRWARHADLALTTIGETDHGLRRAALDNNVALIHQATGEFEEAETLTLRALAIKEAVLGSSHPGVATTLNNLSLIYETTGALEEARAQHERALAIKEQALGADHPSVANSLNNLALVLAASGDDESAKALHERALAIRRRALGPEHPKVAGSLGNLANLYYNAGAYEEAKTRQEQALAIQEQSLGPDHPMVATTLNNVGAIEKAMGFPAEARALHERALTIQEKALGPEHPDLAISLNNLAIAYEAEGQPTLAKPAAERALALWEATMGPEHPNLASPLNNLAMLHQATGANEEAKALYERALQIREKAVGSEHPTLAYSLDGLANIAGAQGDYADAIALARRSLATRESGEAAPELTAVSHFTLSRVLWEAPPSEGRDRVAARAHAKRARELLDGISAHAGMFAEVETWLAEHPG